MRLFVLALFVTACDSKPAEPDPAAAREAERKRCRAYNADTVTKVEKAGTCSASTGAFDECLTRAAKAMGREWKDC